MINHETMIQDCHLLIYTQTTIGRVDHERITTMSKLDAFDGTLSNLQNLPKCNRNEEKRMNMREKVKERK